MNMKTLSLNGANQQTWQSPRQRVWLAIREHRDGFTIQQVADQGQMKYESTREYVAALTKAGVIEILAIEAVHHKNCVVKQRTYHLLKDLGYTAPKLNRKGEFLDGMTGNKAMWNTLRITGKPMTALELSHLASTKDVVISALTAREYLGTLYRAGYLKLVKKAKTTGGQTKYQLLMHMNTGPNPPQILRTKQVFDANTNQVMFQETPALEEELRHGTRLENDDES